MPEYFRAMQFLDTLHGWALVKKKIWKTSNGGINWENVPYPGAERPLIALDFSDFEHGMVQIYKPGGPPNYYSQILWTNNGTDWQIQNPRCLG